MVMIVSKNHTIPALYLYHNDCYLLEKRVLNLVYLDLFFFLKNFFSLRIKGCDSLRNNDLSEN